MVCAATPYIYWSVWVWMNLCISGVYTAEIMVPIEWFQRSFHKRRMGKL